MHELIFCSNIFFGLNNLGSNKDNRIKSSRHQRNRRTFTKRWNESMNRRYWNRNQIIETNWILAMYMNILHGGCSNFILELVLTDSLLSLCINRCMPFESKRVNQGTPESGGSYSPRHRNYSAILKWVLWQWKLSTCFIKFYAFTDFLYK